MVEGVQPAQLGGNMTLMQTHWPWALWSLYAAHGDCVVISLRPLVC